MLQDSQIRRIFLFEGRMISAAGAVIGIALGLLLCWLQQTYGLVQLGDQAGNFVVNAYPISVHPEISSQSSSQLSLLAGFPCGILYVI